MANWQTPKTDWITNPKAPEKQDFNRIEENTLYLLEQIEAKKGAIVYALNEKGQPAELENTYSELAQQIRNIVTPAHANKIAYGTTIGNISGTYDEDGTLAADKMALGTIGYSRGQRIVGTVPFNKLLMGVHIKSNAGFPHQYQFVPGDTILWEYNSPHSVSGYDIDILKLHNNEIYYTSGRWGTSSTIGRFYLTRLSANGEVLAYFQIGSNDYNVEAFDVAPNGNFVGVGTRTYVPSGQSQRTFLYKYKPDGSQVFSPIEIQAIVSIDMLNFAVAVFNNDNIYLAREEIRSSATNRSYEVLFDANGNKIVNDRLIGDNIVVYDAKVHRGTDRLFVLRSDGLFVYNNQLQLLYSNTSIARGRTINIIDDEIFIPRRSEAIIDRYNLNAQHLGTFLTDIGGIGFKVVKDSFGNYHVSYSNSNSCRTYGADKSLVQEGIPYRLWYYIPDSDGGRFICCNMGNPGQIRCIKAYQSFRIV